MTCRLCLIGSGTARLGGARTLRRAVVTSAAAPILAVLAPGARLRSGRSSKSGGSCFSVQSGLAGGRVIRKQALEDRSECVPFGQACSRCGPGCGKPGSVASGSIVALRRHGCPAASSRRPRDKVVRRVLLVGGLLTLTAVSGCSPSSSNQSALARAGRIDPAALIVADQSITICASIDIVWETISRIDEWPEWQSNIRSVRHKGPVSAGQVFEWDNDGTQISSTIELVRAPTDIAWTGSAMGLKAIHVWNLLAQPDGRVLVHTAESMRGFPSSLFYSSSDLQKANAGWLRALKERSEAEMRRTASR